MPHSNRTQLITRASAGALLATAIAVPAAEATSGTHSPETSPETAIGHRDSSFETAAIADEVSWPVPEFDDSALEFSATDSEINYQIAQFSDLTTAYWAANFIGQLLESGIIKGFPNGRFLPEQSVTRAQFAAMLAQAFDDRTPRRDAIAFGDVPRDHWASEAIQNAYQLGFLSPTIGTRFDPNQPMTRLDVLGALTRGLGYSYEGTPDLLSTILGLFNDANLIPTEAQPIVAAAAMRGMLVNYPNARSLDLNRTASRADVAAYLYQALVSMGRATAIESPYAINLEEVEGINIPVNTTPAIDP